MNCADCGVSLDIGITWPIKGISYCQKDWRERSKEYKAEPSITPDTLIVECGNWRVEKHSKMPPQPTKSKKRGVKS